MTRPRQQIGRWGEAIAAKHLLSNGYRIIVRNFRTPHGEVDIIAHLNDLIVFVEVKTRTSSSYTTPEMSVTKRKQAHMLAAAEYYFEKNPGCSDAWQFDVIAIEGRPGKEPVITHFENVLG